MSYTDHFNPNVTPQSKPIPGREAEMVANHAGGYVYEVSKFTVLERFLITGTERGSYYVGAKEQTYQASQIIMDCIAENPARVLGMIKDVVARGRAAKPEPALFVLALMASYKIESQHGMSALIRSKAFAAIRDVCRIPTHLSQFVAYTVAMRGKGRALRTAVAKWYTEHTNLPFHVVKYWERNGWSHRDLLRIAHPKPINDDMKDLFSWIANERYVGFQEDTGRETVSHRDEVLKRLIAKHNIIAGYNLVRQATSVDEVVRCIKEYNLPREAVPTQYLNTPEVWRALLPGMPIWALVRNLGNLGKHGVVASGQWDEIQMVVDKLSNEEAVRKSLIHPLQVLTGMFQYTTGFSNYGRGSWLAVSEVIDALNELFYKSFENVEPTDKEWLVGVDMSGSMAHGVDLHGSITSREAAACIAMALLRAEKKVTVVGYTDRVEHLPLSKSMRLDQVKALLDGPPRGTDCALPILWAIEKGIKPDVVMTITDNETWAGNIHPVQALNKLRGVSGKQTKLISVAMSVTNFSIADPHDPYQIDIAGFDAGMMTAIREFAMLD